MPKSINLTGEQFGKLIVVKPLPMKPRRMWFCQCECGNTTTLHTGALRSGNTKSCGCASPFAKKHGFAGTRLEKKYFDMKRRCYSPKSASFPYYGGRGIEVCEQWRCKPSAFYAWALVNGFEPGLELDRIDVDGNYSPGNCRFVTHQVNSRNRRCVKNSIALKARKVGLKPETVHSRLNRGWDLDRALAEPLRGEVSI